MDAQGSYGQSGSVWGPYRQQAQPKKYGAENNYTAAMGLLGGASGKGDPNAVQGGGAFVNGNSYQMGQALQGLWNSGGGGSVNTNPDYNDPSQGGQNSATAGGGMDMGSMASIAMSFI